MKKILTFALIMICAFSFASCVNKSSKDYDLYCYEINKVIKDIDFDKGKITDGKIVLYNDNTVVFNQNYEKFDCSFNIKYIRKDNNKIFFILNAVVDDEEGIVFVNDDTNSLMDGIGTLERLNGNSYKYKTFQ